MNKLQPPDSFHLRAAQGWLELGDPKEALKELDQINSYHRIHPEVLEVKWQILAKKKRWKQCLELAQVLIRSVPDQPYGWIHLSYVLHETGQTQEAFDNLKNVESQFPDEPIIPYNAACYCCQLDHHDEALDWLRKSMKIGHPEKIKKLAIDDPDLAPLIKQIKRL